MKDLRLMAVLAHPDDESLGFGGTLARYAAEGVQVSLVTATRGEAGRNGDPTVREAELRAAANTLGIASVNILGYPDGALDQVDHTQAIRRIAAEIDRVRPHLVLTFGPDGAYGHPDHIAISQFTTAAVVEAEHTVSKLYYMAWTSRKWEAYQTALKRLTSQVDGIERQAVPWPDWAVTTVLDTSAHIDQVRQAVRCHRTQTSIYTNLENLPAAEHHALWGTQEFYRAFSLVNGGRAVERDLFTGLRASHTSAA